MTKKGKEQLASVDNMLAEGLLRKGSDQYFSYTRIPFHVSVLDDLTGGGIPKKRITILTGNPSAGKSYLASQVVVSAQKSGGTAAWIDTELSWDSDWMKRCGVDTEKVLVSQPVTAESAFDLIRALLDIPTDVVVLDSIAGLVPTNVQVEDFSYSPMAWQARFVNYALPKTIPHLANGSALILINQRRSGMGPGNEDVLPGGEGQRFFSHFILQVRRKGWIEEDDKKVGFDIEVACRKSKVGGKPQESCVIPFRMDGGIDLVDFSVREALSRGLIKQAGAWFSYQDNKIAGMNGVRKFFIENQEKYHKLLEDLSSSAELGKTP